MYILTALRLMISDSTNGMQQTPNLYLGTENSCKQ